jgi:hypothetical protein
MKNCQASDYWLKGVILATREAEKEQTQAKTSGDPISTNSWAQWCATVTPATWEAEMKDHYSRPAWTKNVSKTLS